MSSKLIYNILGRTGLKVSNICLGTMTFGDVPRGLPGNCDEALGHAILEQFKDYGGNFIDTANIDQQGKSEEILGSWLKRQNRDNFVIASKVRFPTNLSDPNARGLSRKHILNSVENSLRRLQTDYIDLLQIHMCDEKTCIKDTLKTLSDLVRSQKIHYIGASNLSGWQLQKMVDYSEFLGLERFVSIQNQYSLLCRDIEFEIFPVCKNEGVSLLAWSPLKGGWLSGKIKSGMKCPPNGSRLAWVSELPYTRANQSQPSWDTFAHDEKVWKLLDVLNLIAKSLNKSVAQVAIRWLLQQELVTSVIIGVKTLEQLNDNIVASSGWELTSQEVLALNKASEIPVPYPYEMLERLKMA